MDTPLRCRAEAAGLLILATLTLTQCSLFEAADDPFPLEATLNASDAAPNNLFGGHVALDGDHALVHALMPSALYFYRWDGAAWREVQRLADPTQGNIHLPVALALDRDRAAVGVVGQDVAVYAWNGAAWTLEATIPHPPRDETSFEAFGSALSLDGDRLLVGAVGDDEKAQNAGAAYLYTWNGTAWTLTQKLTASDARADLGFGKAVALHGDHIVIGGGVDDGEIPIVDVGVAYFFHRDNAAWTEVHVARTNQADNFAQAIALDATHAAIGAPGYTDFGYQPGAVYVYAWNGTAWNQEQVLLLGASTAFVHNGDIAEYQRFGGAVALTGGHLIVGASVASVQRNNPAGAVYLYQRTGTTWQRTSRIDGPDRSTLQFGTAVSASGQRFLVGAPGRPLGDTGRAYVYSGLQP